MTCFYLPPSGMSLFIDAALAMSCGIPVVSTSVGGNQEAIEHERTGLLVPPGDPLALAQAILKLVQDSALRCRVSSQASVTVRERWSFRRYVDTLESAYRTYATGNEDGVV